VHPSGRMLYTAEGGWRIDATDGRLSRGQRLPAASQIVVSHDGTSVYFLDGLTGSIDQATADDRTGEVHCRTNAAVVDNLSSIALKTV
jgi:hypothetical protein